MRSAALVSDMLSIPVLSRQIRHLSPAFEQSKVYFLHASYNSHHSFHQKTFTCWNFRSQNRRLMQSQMYKSHSSKNPPTLLLKQNYGVLNTITQTTSIKYESWPSSCPLQPARIQNSTDKQKLRAISKRYFPRLNLHTIHLSIQPGMFFSISTTKNKRKKSQAGNVTITLFRSGLHLFSAASQGRIGRTKVCFDHHKRRETITGYMII